jgi:hypothetical protein
VGSSTMLIKRWPSVIAGIQIISIIISAPALAQALPPVGNIQSQAELDKVVTALDTSLFDAYNRCDLVKYKPLLADNLEFYDDQSGETIGKNTDNLEKYICGKVRRELVPGTLQAFYMKGYGAVEVGVHRFYHPGHDDTEPVGEARFTILWHYDGDAWAMSRIISYNHHLASK